ncbi:hypothetical protein LPJ56_000587 [Coemansia sp. RSA 2599]|nr:hypothetical protein LPJ75_000274 [Coemansia sp. RSA 2598]KAJ1829161.1 hypothetical protein LPJ56_000587 [Coemansia sp. RSA 2599]
MIKYSVSVFSSAALAILLMALVAAARNPLNHRMNKRIVGGSAVAEGKYKFAVHLTIKTETTEYLCGGSLLANNLVVTAAHCMVDADTNSVYQPSQVTVCYGSVNVNKMSCTSARNITVNNKYNPETYVNDIALIQISPLKSSSFSTVKIYMGELPESTELITMGWGKTSDSSAVLPSTLMSTTIKVGDSATCKLADGSYQSANGPEICSVNAMTPGKDSCSGDSGSPTVIEIDGQDYLAGLTSTGVDLVHPEEATCATRNGVAFYTHIREFRQFIAKVTGLPENSFDAANTSKYSPVGGSGTASGSGSGSGSDSDSDSSSSSSAATAVVAPGAGSSMLSSALLCAALAAASLLAL